VTGLPIVGAPSSRLIFSAKRQIFTCRIRCKRYFRRFGFATELEQQQRDVRSGANEKLFQANSLFDVRYRDIRFSPKASAPPDDAKRKDTKTRRLQKIVPIIASGIGLNDKYR
jgi:hypothetical protein